MTLTFTMTARMMTIAAVCALLLCIVLFVLGVQIGSQYGRPASHALHATAADTLSAQPAAAGTTDANDSGSATAMSSSSSDTSKQ